MLVDRLPGAAAAESRGVPAGADSQSRGSVSLARCHGNQRLLGTGGGSKKAGRPFGGAWSGGRAAGARCSHHSHHGSAVILSEDLKLTRLKLLDV